LKTPKRLSLSAGKSAMVSARVFGVARSVFHSRGEDSSVRADAVSFRRINKVVNNHFPIEQQ
jgi:hypothetical protein